MIKVIEGDCRNISFPPNYFDTLITDPPYGLEFMGKDWDAGVPGVVFWKKFLTMCKPGAFALVFGGTRTYHRLACAIEDAGWEIRDCIMWIYGSGFPKSLDISKAIDKKAGVHQQELVPTKKGNQKFDRGTTYATDTHTGFRDISKPKTDLAKLWNGWGTALKPAWEPIIVAMKPLDGTFAQNAEKWGVAGLWIDGGRIGTTNIKTCGGDKFKGQGIYGKYNTCIESTHVGRWPANVILDEEAGAMLDEQTGELKGPWGKESQSKNPTSWYSGLTNSFGKLYRDSGGASRFFYCAKASKKERNAGLQGMEEEPVALNTGNAHHVAPLGRETKYQNNHPTVKPLALMEYLCKLSRTPTGGRVLDPFGGSGTTALACINTSRHCVIVEKETAYCEIARERINACSRPPQTQ